MTSNEGKTIGFGCQIQADPKNGEKVTLPVREEPASIHILLDGLFELLAHAVLRSFWIETWRAASYNINKNPHNRQQFYTLPSCKWKPWRSRLELLALSYLLYSIKQARETLTWMHGKRRRGRDMAEVTVT